MRTLPLFIALLFASCAPPAAFAGTIWCSVGPESLHCTDDPDRLPIAIKPAAFEVDVTGGISAYNRATIVETKPADRENSCKK